MTTDRSAPSAHPEAALPPPRPFGDNCTLTLPLGRRAAWQPGGELLAGFGAGEPWRVAIVEADRTALTLTY